MGRTLLVVVDGNCDGVPWAGYIDMQGKSGMRRKVHHWPDRRYLGHRLQEPLGYILSSWNREAEHSLGTPSDSRR